MTTNFKRLPRYGGIVLAFTICSAGGLFAQSSEVIHLPEPGKLAVRAKLVLSPKFCSTKKRQSIALEDVLHVGKSACAQLYEALTPMFLDLRRVQEASARGTSAPQITLIPKFKEISATQQPFLPSSQRKLLILLEWTILDSAGHTIWLQTVEGSSEHKGGWMITSKGLGAMVDAAVADLAKNSVSRISAAPELRNLPQ